MPLTSLLSNINRSRKAPRQQTAGMARDLSSIETLALLQHFANLKQEAASRNPLLLHGAKHHSQNDEDGIIAHIASRVLGLRGTFLELGPGDGTENNTLNLLMQGWRGGWIGGEPIRLASTGTRLRFLQGWIDREHVVEQAAAVLKPLGIECPDLLSIDLDGNDWYICQALLQQGWRPAIVVVEYNARFAANVRWTMPYRPDHVWDGSDWFGASLGAYCDLLRPAGYSLVACNLTGSNAFFVREDALSLLPELPSNLPDAWERLYMPPCYLRYPWTGHPPSIRTIEHALAQ